MAVVAVVGSRSGVSAEFVWNVLDDLVTFGFIGNGDGVVSGGAAGVDTFAKLWSEAEGREFRAIFPKHYSRKELLLRNAEIVNIADKLVAFKSTKSKTKGTDHVYGLALKKGIPTKLFYYPVIPEYPSV